jgi:carboxylate-amine ligase
VEEEFLLYASGVPRLLDVGPVIAQVADSDASPEERDSQFQKELMKAQTEHASPATPSLDELGATLTGQRDRLIAAASARDARLVASGTSPARDTTSTTEDKRYGEMIDRFAAVARGQLTCAMHIHVSVDSPDEGVAVIDRTAPWLPVIAALSANSPFHDGRDTGYASYRRMLWGLWPTSGPTTAFEDAMTYGSVVDDLVATGAARDRGMIYFDARLSEKYPTVEIRVCDVVREVDDAVTIAGLLRALVSTVALDGSAPCARVELLHAAGWRAARYGLDDTLVDLTGVLGGHRLVPAWDLVEGLLEYIGPELDAAGDLDRVREGIASLRRRGVGAARQRSAAQHGGLAAVIGAMSLPGNA